MKPITDRSAANAAKATGARCGLLATICLLFFQLTNAQPYAPSGGILYVDQHVSAPGNGSSWASAVPELADALKWAKENEGSWSSSNPLKIYVAKGIYKPKYSVRPAAGLVDEGRDNTFLLVRHVQLYGGFDPDAGITGLADPRLLPDPRPGAPDIGTVLSGDLDGNDLPDGSNNGNNVHHVVVAIEVDHHTVLDGFTITGGNADDDSGIDVGPANLDRNEGGGMVYMYATPTTIHLKIRKNRATAIGGGVAVVFADTGAEYAFRSTVICDNHAGQLGGGMSLYAGKVQLTDVCLARNSAAAGGGIWSSAFVNDLRLTNATVTGNSGTVSNTSGADAGGGIILRNSIFTDLIRGAIDGLSGRNNLFNEDVSTVFADWANGDYRLKATGPAINAGNDTYYTDAGGNLDTGTDAAGKPRKAGSAIDIGAFEYPINVGPDDHNILYVDKQVTGRIGDGRSWTTAMPELRDALQWAAANWDAGADGTLQIWVTKGTYTPVLPVDDSNVTVAERQATFRLVGGVEVYGGFAGGETTRDARDWKTNTTILSGDIDGNDTGADGVITNPATQLQGRNSYHVVTASDVNQTALLDGFLITAGHANTSPSHGGGGGVFNNGGHLALVNLTIQGNRAVNTGGGVFNGTDSRARLTNVTISHNASGGSGAGVLNMDADVWLTNAVIRDNNADGNGGGITNSSGSTLRLTNTEISGNTAYNGGAMYTFGGSSAVLTNVTVTGNSLVGAGIVGGLYSDDATLTLANTVVWNNTKSDGLPDNLYTPDGTLVVRNSLLQGDPESWTWGTAWTGNDGGGNIITGGSPFADEAAGDYRLRPASQALNTGSNEAYESADGDNGNNSLANDTDLAGNPRVFHVADGGVVDIGAYESPYMPIKPTARILYINAAVDAGKGPEEAVSDQSGSSWANAIPELSAALQWAQANKDGGLWDAGQPLQLYVAGGEYRPGIHPSTNSPVTNEHATFLMVKDVQLYGGFPQSGDPTMADRDWKTHTTTLKGVMPNGNPVYHAVVSAGDVGQALMDGFTITGAHAKSVGSITVNGETIDGLSGGGMINVHSSPTLTNLIVAYNSAEYIGGGVYNSGSSPVLANVTITDNSAAEGGGICNSASSPYLTNVIIARNTGRNWGGGISNRGGSPRLTNVLITGNELVGSAGGTGAGGGMYNSGSHPVLTNVTIVGNSAPYDSELSNRDSSFPTLHNSIVWGAVNLEGITAYHSLIWGENTTDNGNIDASTVSDASVLFTDPANGDYRLLPGSPAIDAGSNAGYEAADEDDGNNSLGTDMDLAGNPRVFRVADGGVVDIGAYESPYAAISPTAGVLYVDIDVDLGKTEGVDVLSNQSGSSWENALTDLQIAIGTLGVREVWVAAGTYPAPAGSFSMKNGVAVYGGFPAGGGGWEERDWRAHQTILDGAGVHRVVYNTGLDATAVLDGVTITGGRSVQGGGMYNTGSSPTLTNLVFTGNTATDEGGGMYNTNSHPTLTNVTINGNSSDFGGGGIFNWGGSAPVLTNVLISNNSSANGGGIFSQDGGMVLTNVTIAGNTASNWGGGMLNQVAVSAISYSFTNVILWGNTAAVAGPGIYNNIAPTGGLTMVFSHSLYEAADIAWSNDGSLMIDGGSASFSADPQFVDAANGDYRLLLGSPAIDAGNNALYELADGDDGNNSLLVDTDLAGNPRVTNLAADGIIDIGAYESPYMPIKPTARILYVSTAVDAGKGPGETMSDQSGSSWDNAIPQLRDALRWAADNQDKGLWSAAEPLQIWVAGGKYTPVQPADPDNVTPSERGATFQLTSGVQLYGGFAGGETTLAERDWKTNITILSGDIDGNDTGADGVITNPATEIQGANSYHVVTASGTDETTVLNGVTVTAGNADGPDADANGGGIYIHAGSPALVYVDIRGNRASNGGGAFHTANSNPRITNTIIRNNQAASGGGIYNEASTTTLTNVVVARNTGSDAGGGMLVSTGSVTMNNSIAWRNVNGEGTLEHLKTIDGTMTSSHSMLEGFTKVVAWVSGWGWDTPTTGNDGGGNIIENNSPFVDEAAGDFSLRRLSLAVDAGSNALYEAADGDAGNNSLADDADLAGNPRVYDPVGRGIIDMGVSESPYVAIHPTNGILYVNAAVDAGKAPGDALSDQSGSSWENAMTVPGEIRQWLADRVECDLLPTPEAPLQVWVAKGVYTPATVSTDLGGFSLYNNVGYYGGFAGGETDLNQRDWKANTTILSGDIGGDDTGTDGIITDPVTQINGINSATLVTADDMKYSGSSEKINQSAVLDGFTLTAGYGGFGGAINIASGSPTLTNLDIRGNYAASGGGVAISRAVEPRFTNVAIRNNYAEADGGGMHVKNKNSSPEFVNVLISDNVADMKGGGIYSEENLSMTFTNVTITGNQAETGGGMFNAIVPSGSPVHSMNNVILWGNTAVDGPDIHTRFYMEDRTLTLNVAHSIFNKDGMVSTFQLFEVGEISDGSDRVVFNDGEPSVILNQDPEFVDPAAGDYRLQLGSPAIDAGSNEWYEAADGDEGNNSLDTDVDLAGIPRVHNHMGIVDIGAYEYQPVEQAISEVAAVGKTYGDEPFEPGATANSGLPVSYASSDNTIAEAFEDADDGNKWKIRILKAGEVTITAIQAGDSDYLPADNQTFTLTVAPRLLTITANNHTVLYSGTAYSGGNGVAYAGFAPDEDETVLGGTLSYSGTSQGAVNADTYVISPGGLTSDSYAITYVNGTLTISGGAQNTLSFNVQQAGSTVARTYGDGDVDGSAVASSGLSVTYGSSDESVATINTNGQISIVGVGTAVITAAQEGNVNYAPAADIVFSLEVSPKALNVTARNATKVYDGTPYSGGAGVDYSGFVVGEGESVLTGTLTYGGTSQNAVTVGSYVITPAGLSADNYTIAYINGRLDIVPSGGNVLTFDSQTAGSTVDVVYGASPLSAAARATSGLAVTYRSSNESVAAVAADGTVTIGGAGTARITASQPGDVNHDAAVDIHFTLQVARTELVVTANNDSKTYDGAAYSGGNGVQYTGFAYGEDETVLGGTPTYTGSSQGAVAVSSYSIVPGGLTSPNYTITYRNGSLSVTKRPVTVSFAAGAEISKVYDGSAAATMTAADLSFGAGEVVGGDELTITLSSGTGSYADADAGDGKEVTLPLDGMTLGGADRDNYAIGNNAPVTGDAGVITPRPLTITANNHTVLYSGTAYSGGNGVAYAGFAPDEDEAVLDGTLSYSGTSQGAVNADTYVISPGGLTADNYAITYVDGTLTISGGAANTLSFNVQQAGSTVARTYGDGDVDGSAVASSGLSVTYSSSDEGVATINTNGQISIIGVGTAVITAGQGGNVNYAPAADIVFSLEVSPKALNVTARNATKVYDGTPYSGGAGVDYSGFVVGEGESVLTGTLTYGGTSQNAMTVGSYVITPSGLSADNYTIAYINGRLDIVPSGGNVLTFDSQTAGSTVDVVYGASPLSAAARATSGLAVNYATSNVQVATVSAAGEVTITGAGTARITASQPGDVNHDAAADIHFTLQVARTELVVTANNDSKTYNGAAYSGGNGVQYTGFVYGQDASVLTGSLSYGGTSQSASDVGSYGIIPSGLNAGNYTITYRNGSLSVTKRPVTVSFAAGAEITKTYDGSAAATIRAADLSFGAGEVVGGDQLTITLSTGAGSYADEHAGDGKEVTLPLDGITLGGADRDNYAISNNAPVTGNAGVITPRLLTITANNHTVLYSGTAYSGGNGVAYAGFAPDEDETVLDGTLSYGGTSQGAVNADTYVISPGGLTSGNYAITYVNGTLTISGGAQNTLSFNVQQAGSTVVRTYGDGDVDGSAVASSGLSVTYGSSDESVATINTNGQISIVGVGTAVITASQGGNVNYAPAADIVFSLEVSPKALAITARNATKVYDGTPYSGGAGVDYSGFIAGESEAVLTGTLTYGGTSQNAVTVGSYVITPAGLSADNYTITYINGRLDIVPSGGNVLTFDSQTAGSTVGVTYGASPLSAAARATSGLSVTYSSNNESVAAVAADGTVTIRGAGTARITASQGGDVNHDAAADIHFTLQVARTELIVTANNDSKTYDGAAYSGGNGVQYTGFVYGQDASVLTGSLSYGGTSQSASDVGSYGIIPSGLNAGNYTITYRNGSLSVTKRPVTVSFAAGAEISKTYDGSAAATITAADLAFGAGEVVGGDELTITLSSGTGSYDDADAGDGKEVTLPLDGMTLGGTDRDNYAIGNNAPVTGDAGVITPRPLTITANNHTVLYSGTAYSGGNGVAYVGFAPDEDEAVLDGTLSYSGTSQGAVNADTYVISPDGLTSDNYAITYVEGTLTISGGAANTLSFNVQQAGGTVARTYGDGDVDGSAVASSGLSVTYSSSDGAVATIDANGQISIVGVGTADITASQEGNVNYAPAADIVFSLEVSPKALNVTARNATKVYDGTPYSGGAGVDYSGFVVGEGESVLTGTLTYGGTSQNAVTVGSYVIIPAGLSADNYTIAYINGRLDIVPSGGNVLTFDSQTAGSTVDVVYGASPLSAAARATSGLAVTYSSSNESVAAVAADGTVTIGGAGTARITASQPGDVNHDAAVDIHFTLQVARTELVVTANNDSKTYDGAAYSGGNGVQYTGFVYGQDASVLTGSLSYGGTSQGAADVGSYGIIPSGLTAGNYTITYRNGSLSVTKRPVTVSFAAGAEISKVYDGSAAATMTAADLSFGAGEVVVGDELQVVLATGAGSYADKHAGTGRQVTLPLDGMTLGGADKDNYAIANNAPVTGDAGVITPRPLTITANNHTVLYTGTAYSGGNGVAYAGFAPDEDEAVLDGTLSYSGTSQGAIAANTYTLIPGGYTSANYAITFVPGVLTISGGAANILSFNVQQAGGTVARTYGDGDVDGSAVASSGLSVTYSSSDEGVATIDANGQISIVGVGTADITASQEGNVNYAPAADIVFSLEVSPKALNVTARNATKVYDGTPYSGGAGVDYSGFVVGEGESVLTGTLTYGGTSQTAVTVGSYVITPSGLSADNYTIAYINGRLDIVPSGGNVLTFDSQTAGSTVEVTYGATPLSAAARATSGLAVNYATSNVQVATVSAAGEVTITGAGTARITASQGGDVNHDAAADIHFTLQVARTELVVTANNDSKTYDGAAYSGGNGVQYTGFVYGQDASVLTGSLSYGGTSQGAADVGSYGIIPSGLNAGNYTITYRNGSLSVTKRPVTLGFAPGTEISKVYDGGMTASITAADLGFGAGEVVAGDDLFITLASGNGNYDNESTGENKQVTLPLDGLVLSGSDKDNYAIGNNAPIGGGVGIITRRPLTIQANNHTVLYSGTAYSGGNGVAYVGFAPDEDEAVLDGTLSYSGTSQGAVNADTYVISPDGLTSDNYAITYVEGTLTISGGAANTLSFNVQQAGGTVARTYGDGDVDGSAVASSGLSVTYSSSDGAVATIDANGQISIVGVGTADITASQEGNVNYAPAADIVFSLEVSPKALNVTARNATKVYDGTPYSGGAGVDYSGFVVGEGESVLTGTLAYGGTSQNAVTVGSYVITPSGLSADNYTIAYINGRLDIVPSGGNVLTFDSQTAGSTVEVTYGATPLSAAARATSGLAVNYATSNVQVATVSAAGEVTITGAGTARITASQDGDVNHDAAADIHFTLQVARKELIVTANNDSKTYDGAAYSGGNGVQYTGFVYGQDASVLTGSLSYGGTSQGAADVGSYGIIPSGLTAGNYTITYRNGSLSVTKRAVTVGFASGVAITKVYDGTATATITADDLGFGSNEIITGDNLAVTLASGTGSYDNGSAGENKQVTLPLDGLVLGGSDKDNYAIGNNAPIIDHVGVISKAQPVITAAATQTHVYDGTEKTVTATVVPAELADQLQYSPQSSFTDVGEHRVRVYLNESANYLGAEAYTDFGITPVGQQGLALNNLTVTYNGNVHRLEVSGAASDATVTYTINGQPGNSAVDAGSYEVVAVVKRPNHADEALTGTLYINKAAAVITADTEQEHTYDGTAKTVEAALNHTETSLSFTPQQSYTAAGSYTVTVSAGETANYHAANATVTLRILPADQEGLSLPDRTVTYTGWAHSLSVQGLAEGATVTYTINGQVGNSATDAGSYAVVAVVSRPNYADKTLTGMLTINRAAAYIPGEENQIHVYDGTAKSLVIELSHGEGTLSYSPGNSFADAGTYTITVSAVQTANYEAVSKTFTLRIDRAVRTLDFPSLPAKTYGDGDFAAGATAGTGEAVIYTSSNPAVATVTGGTIRIVGAGTATITATVADNANYSNRPEVSRTLTVAKASQTITLSAPAEVNRDAGSVAVTATAGSGLPVSLGIDDPEVATLSGTALHIHRLGTVRITATQAGDGNHHAADTATVTVRVVDPSSDFPIRVSKAVSPNGDGINEYLIIEAIKDHPENRVRIFNRNGTVVYEAGGYNNGTVAFRGIGTGQHRVPAGTYFYAAEIRVNGEWVYEKGWFVLRY